MNLTEQLLSRREIYHGRIIDVQVDTVSLPNGNTSTREVVRHPGFRTAWRMNPFRHFPKNCKSRSILSLAA